MTQSMKLLNDDSKYWNASEESLLLVNSRITDKMRVLEIGPGAYPFRRADIYCDYKDWGSVDVGKLVLCDSSMEKLPFYDKEFDFVYCRHVLEDMTNPVFLCSEMSRVAKAGYLETPSPMAEFIRGVDGGSPSWRGYHHHRYLCWNNENVIYFLAKYPCIEYIQIEAEEKVIAYLKRGARFWNTYYFWSDKIECKYLQHDIDYNVVSDYSNILLSAFNSSVNSSNKFMRAAKDL
jgi:hypothetical protein